MQTITHQFHAAADTPALRAKMADIAHAMTPPTHLGEPLRDIQLERVGPTDWRSTATYGEPLTPTVTPSE